MTILRGFAELINLDLNINTDSESPSVEIPKISKYEQVLFKKSVQPTLDFDLQVAKFMTASASSVDPEEFWMVQKNNFGLLFQMWQRLATITPSNASVERLFSLAKLIENDLRSRILPENLENFIISRNFK